ncbi:M56 family metallopeptidase [uncultured Lacinutrix sp.]|uniref:M56 family metallopeptidase n=1 Tax=uncultured Lacinutrix sp. TaxID=574032 RepID=UPI00261CCB4E|nr:M56 family metallopeptidase [uncultured Lacinutrix sp.]
MIKFGIYLLESSIIFLVFYLLYEFIMKKETCFNFNRFYLIGIVVFSLLLPLMSFNFSKGKIAAVDHSIEEFNDFRMSYYDAIQDWESNAFSVPISKEVSANSKEIAGVPVDWSSVLIKLLLGIYGIGVCVCLSKLLWALWRLKRMVFLYPKTKINDVTVVKLPSEIASFSFFGYAFIYEGKIDTPELNQIVAHEKVHIEQRHSIDLIFVQFIASFLWFNPLLWTLIKSLKTTHEYIVDQKIINTGYSLVDYQTLLLSELVSNNSYGLVNNFNLSFIKKRITMMTNNKSGFSGKVKMALTVTCTVLFSLVLFQCNSEKTDDISDELREMAKNNYNNLSKESKEQLRRQAELVFSISNNIISVNGKTINIKDIEPILTEVGIGRHYLVRFKIEGNQSMRTLSEVQAELRNIDRRKVLYNGETDSGKQMIQPFLVPPMHWANPSHDDSIPVKPDLSKATHNGNVATLDGIEYLNINISEGGNYRETVYNFVKNHIARQSTAYLIRVEYNDTDNFKNYLTNLAEVYQGFETVYKVRAQELYGKDFSDLKKEEYISIGKEAPKSVFIAGK